MLSVRAVRELNSRRMLNGIGLECNWYLKPRSFTGNGLFFCCMTVKCSVDRVAGENTIYPEKHGLAFA
jgi:hypothetical protein